MPAPSVPGTTLRQTAERIVVGEDRLVAVRDFLDHIPRRGSEELATVIEEEPQVTGDGEADALLAAIALAFDARRVTRDIDAVFEPKMRSTRKPATWPAMRAYRTDG